MTDRATVNQRVQWGVEATPGTAVAATKSVRSMQVDVQVGGANELFRPDGHKFNSLVIPNMEWAALTLAGRPTYTEIIYPLTAMMGASTDTAVGTTGMRRVWTVDDIASMSKKTLTIEKGSAVRAEQVAFGLFTDMGFSFSRKNGITLSGQGIGQLITDPFVLTASVADVPLVPVVGRQLDFFIDSSGATLGTTKMLRAFLVEQQIGNTLGPIWPLNSSMASFADVVELAPTSTFRIRLEADAAGMAYLSQFRSGDTIFARLLGTGAVFETVAGTPPTDYNYTFQYDACLGIKSPSNLGQDEEGVTVVDWECELVRDSTWGKAFQVTVQNDVAAL